MMAPLQNNSKLHRPLLISAWAMPVVTLLSAYLAICYQAGHLGHQVRELLTHMLVTVPLFWAVCLYLAGLSGPLLGLFLLVAALHTSAASQGQTDSLILLICPHFFEHTFSYCVVPCAAGLTYQNAVLKTLRRQSTPH